jgi:hypothetical protein
LRAFSPAFLQILALLIVAAFEAIALIEQVFFPYWPAGVAGIDGLETEVFRALAPLSPILLLAVLYAWAFRFVTITTSNHWTQFGHAVKTLSEPLSHLLTYSRQPDTLKGIRVLRYPWILLVIGMVSAALLGLVPYRVDLNPGETPVGVDTPQYVDWVSQMLLRPVGEAILYAFGQASQGSRPLPLLLLYSAASVGGLGATQVVKFQPLVLGPLLVLSSFVLTRVGLSSEKMAGTVALFTSFSFPITVGMWAGYYANWMALIEGNLLLASLLRFLDFRSKRRYIVLFSLSLALLLTHPWTWALFLAAIFVFALVRWTNGRDLPLLKAVAVLLIGGFLFDVSRNLAAGGLSLGADVATKTSVTGIPQLLMFWPSLVEAVMITYDGLLGQPVYFALALFSLTTLRLRDNFQGLLVCWVATTSVPFAFLNSFHMSRMIYDLPIAILASIGLLPLLSAVGKGELRPTLLLVVVVLFSANYALRAVIQLTPP